MTIKVLPTKRNTAFLFAEAKTVFYDEAARLIHDPDHSDQVERFILFGMSNKLRLLIVVHTYRDDVIRIISARKATNNEAAKYNKG